MRSLLMILLTALTCSPAWADAFRHDAWDALLRQNVVRLRDGQATGVDYAGMGADQQRLSGYLDAVSAVTQAQFDAWLPNEQLAFLINAYNAWTVQLVLTAYPGIESIRDLGSLLKSPWRKKFIPLLGRTRSLDDIEHTMIRGSGRYHEPRIHFAVNCASIGCPALRAEAFRGDRLGAQLENQTRLFLSDRSRNGRVGDTLRVSPIFKWYREDFEQGWHGLKDLRAFLAAYAGVLGLSDADATELRAGGMRVEFGDYDWQLNDQRTRP